MYKKGDIIKCKKLFSTKNKYLRIEKYLFNSFVSRVISKNDSYKIIDKVSNDLFLVKEIPINKSVVYADPVLLEKEQIDKYFTCERIVRIRKLKKLKKNYFQKFFS